MYGEYLYKQFISNYYTNIYIYIYIYIYVICQYLYTSVYMYGMYWWNNTVAHRTAVAMHLECVPCSTYIYAMPICVSTYTVVTLMEGL